MHASWPLRPAADRTARVSFLRVTTLALSVLPVKQRGLTSTQRCNDVATTACAHTGMPGACAVM